MNTRNPDLVVHYHMYIQQKDRLEVETYYGEEFGPHAHPLFDTQVEVNVTESVEGTMMIDISDAVDNRFVWRGWGRFDVTNALDDQKALDEQLSKAIQEIIKEFPAG